MTVTALRDDALRATPDGFTLLLGLPWIRSLPVASLVDLSVAVDGQSATDVTIELDGRRVAPTALGAEDTWWFLQDRLTIRGSTELAPGPHVVAVTFRLVVPYLQAGPDGPLTLPFHLERTLTADASASGPATARTSSPRERPFETRAAVPAGWTLTASAFNWTPEVVRAERDAAEIEVGIVADGIVSAIELEAGQLWRSFPDPDDTEVDAFRRDLEAVGGSVSIVGASLDDWLSPARRRDDDERLAFLIPQLHAARRVGAAAVRLPIGQAGTPLLRRIVPVLHDLDLVLYEEAQGQQSPQNPATAAAFDAIADIDDPHVRALVDISMLMPSLPPSYLERLRTGGVDEAFLDRVATDWRDPATNGAVIDLLRADRVPAEVHTMFMDLLVRFGRSDAADLRGILPLVGAIHLKFWDLDDEGGRVSQPIRDLAAELAAVGFTGTLCSEWGGHEWLDEDSATMTRAHLALASSALDARARDRV